MSKSSKNSFLMQGMILAAASIVCRVIGLLYRSPLFGIIGKEGMGYYSYAYNIYNIILLIASFSIPLAVSKSISARLAKKEYINAQRIFYGALVYAVVVGGIASMIAYFGAPLSDIKKVQHLPFRSFPQRSFSLGFLEYLEDIFKDIIQWCQHPFPRSLSRS